MAAIKFVLEKLSFVTGLVFFFAAFFAYDTELGIVKNGLDVWWVSVTDTKKYSVPRQVVFTAKAFRFFVNSGNWLFGTRIVALRPLFVGFMLSGAVFSIVPPLISPVLEAMHLHGGSVVHGHLPLGSTHNGVQPTFLSGLGFGLKFLSLSLVPAVLAVGLRDVVKLIAIAFLLFIGWDVLFFVAFGLFAALKTRQVSMLYIEGTWLFGGIVDVLFLAVLTWTLRKWGDVANTWNALCVLVLSAILGFTIVALPIWLWLFVTHSALLGGAVLLSLATIMANAFVALSVVFAVMMIFAQQLFWQLLERPIRAIYRIMPNRKYLATVGAIFVGISWHNGVGQLILKLMATLGP